MRSSFKVFLFILTAITFVVTGCGKKRTSGDLPPTDTIPLATPNPDGIIPGTPGHADTLDPAVNVWSTGGSAVFQPVNNSTFSTWVSSHPVEPMNPLINVRLKKVANKNTYQGEVKIRYQHNGTTYEATLKSGTGTYDGDDYYKYNYWFNYQGKKVFSGFFEDKVGAIILVVDQYLDLGDGGGATEIGGEVWFKNFQTSWAQYDEGGSWSVVLPCWFRTTGPYDCRSDSVIYKTSLYPNNGYQKLGEFSNMNKVKAFDN
jgi:hypothetical protein